MSLTALPRTLVRTGLGTLRLPLMAVEPILNGSDREWPPLRTFDQFEAAALRLFGALLSDDELVNEGHRIDARVSRTERADRLEEEAERQRRQADERFEQRRARADAARRQVADEAEEKGAEIDQKAARAKQAARKQAGARRARADKATQTRKRAVRVQDRAAAKSRLQAQERALTKEQQALDAAGTAKATGRAVRATKATRKRR